MTSSSTPKLHERRSGGIETRSLVFFANDILGLQYIFFMTSSSTPKLNERRSGSLEKRGLSKLHKLDALPKETKGINRW